jgi:hypothetical protein
MKIIFLDIDGTMCGHPETAAPSAELEDRVPFFEREAVIALNRILQRTGARIVISSDWARLGRDRIEELLIKHGVAATLHEDWRTNPLSSSVRSSEINWWLDAHPEIRAWAAIDDDPSVQRMHRGWFIARPGGLGVDDVEGVVGLLGEGPEPAALTGVPKTLADFDARCRAVMARFFWVGANAFGCPAGWLDLLEAGLARAERRVHREELAELKLRRLDLWRGALRLDVNNNDAAFEMWRIERQSVEICAACGAPGYTRTLGEEWVTLCDCCIATDRQGASTGLPPTVDSSPPVAPPIGTAPSANVRDDEVAELAARVSEIEGERTEIRVRAVARLLWSGWELDDRVACVESVRTAARHLLILTQGPDTPEPAGRLWLAERQQDWRAAIAEIDSLIEIAGSGRPPKV